MRLPKDLMSTAYDIIRGYERRKRLYALLRESIQSGTKIKYYPFNDVPVRGANPSDPTAASVLQLEAVNETFDAKVINAVDSAFDKNTVDLPNTVRPLVREAILRNCVSGRNEPFEKFNLPIGRTEFYNRKNQFVFGVLENLGMINTLFIA